MFGPPLPFLPPAPYPAPPPYCEATRPSYDHLDHRHLYDALLSGKEYASVIQNLAIEENYP